MTGLLLQRVFVAALLAVTLLLASPKFFPQHCVAVAATTEDTEASGGKQGKDGQNDSGQKRKVADGEKVDGAEQIAEPNAEPIELLPLDLGTGATAKESPEAEDVLAGGVTATASSKGRATTPSQEPPNTGVSNGSLDPLRLWTPNSGRFLLKDRQAGLALASSADTEDKGDGKPAKAIQPQATKPAENAHPAFTSFGFPSESTTPELENGSPNKPINLPSFISGPNPEPTSTEGEINQPVVGETDNQVEDTEPGKATGSSPLLFSLTDNETAGGGEGPEASGTVGVIRQKSKTADGAEPTSGDNGIFASNGELGESIVGVSPWRGLSVFLLCLAMVFAAFWAAQKFRGKLGRLPGRTLSVIETIGIGAGRQIIIIEMNDDALILGVTPNSINMLDKVPLATLNSGYSAAVDGIISREGAALPGQWESRPRFDTAIEGPTLAPPIQTGTYSPFGQAKTSVAELRRTRQTAIGTGSFAQVAEPPQPKNPKEELLGKFRSQLNRFEE